VSPPHQPHANVVPDIHGVEQSGKLEDVADSASEHRQLVAIHVADVITIDRHAAAVRLKQTDDQLQGDAFSGPRRPDDDGILTVGHLQRQPL
jgi:hypothetical protein